MLDLPEGRLQACEFPVCRNNAGMDIQHMPLHCDQECCSYIVQPDRGKWGGNQSLWGNSAHQDKCLSEKYSKKTICLISFGVQSSPKTKFDFMQWTFIYCIIWSCMISIKIN